MCGQIFNYAENFRTAQIKLYLKFENLNVRHHVIFFVSSIEET